MIKTDVFLLNDSDPVGYIATQQPITGTRINSYGLIELTFFTKNISDPIQWAITSKFKIPGSPRLQQVWDFKDQITLENLLILRQVILKPEGLCIACAGTGKFIASRHKANAKCPTCKGAGFTTNVWIEEKEDTNERPNKDSP